MNEDTAFPDDLRRRLEGADPARLLTDHPEPWRLRESIIMSDLPVSDPAPEPVSRSWRWHVLGTRLVPAGLAAAFAAMLLALPGGSGDDLPVIRINGGLDGVGAAPVSAEAAGDMASGSKMMAPYWWSEYRFDLSAIKQLPGKAPVYRVAADDGGGFGRFAAGAAEALGGLAPLGDDNGNLAFGSEDWTGPRFDISASGMWSFSANQMWPVYDPCAPLPEPLDAALVLANAESFLASIGAPADGLKVDYVDSYGSMVSAPVMVDGFESGFSTSVSLSPTGEVTYASGFAGRFEKLGDYPLAGFETVKDRLEASPFGGFVGFGGAAVRSATGGVSVGAAVDGGLAVGDAAASGVAVPEATVILDDPSVAPTAELSPPVVIDPARDPYCDGSSSGSPSGSPSGSGTGSFVGASGSGVIDPVPAPEVPPTDPGLTPEPLPVETMPVETPPVETMPPAEPEIIDVTVVSAEVGYTPIWDVDGIVWLVPQFVFIDADGIEWFAMALDDRFLEEVMPQVTVAVDPPLGEPEPMPVEPAPEMRTADGALLTDAVIGLSEEAAMALVESSGYQARVVMRDGEGLAVTADFSLERLNLVIEGSTVVKSYPG